MKRGILFFRILLIMLSLLIVVPSTSAVAQNRKSNPITGEGFRGRKVKKKKIKPTKEKKVRYKGKAGKAQKKQAKKAAALDKKNAKADSKLKSHHFEIQGPATQERMVNNRKRTDESYKAKREKIRKESHKPKKHRKP